MLLLTGKLTHREIHAAFGCTKTELLGYDWFFVFDFLVPCMHIFIN